MSSTSTERPIQTQKVPLGLQVSSKLNRLLYQNQESAVHISGTHSPVALAQLVHEALVLQKGTSHVVVVNSDKEIESTYEALRFFNQQLPIYTLKAFDVSPYSALYPNPRLVSQRVQWLFRAQQSTGQEVFLTSVSALLQKTMPFQALKERTLLIKEGSELPENLSEVLDQFGYASSPLVEDVGTYSMRGGILDIYSPAENFPVRMELFGDTIDSMRFFDSETQRSLEGILSYNVIPPREVVFSDEARQSIIRRFRQSADGRNVDPGEVREVAQSLIHMRYFHGIDFLLPYFYETLASPLDHFSAPLVVWKSEPLELARHHDQLLSELKNDFQASQDQAICVDPQLYYESFENLHLPPDTKTITLESISIQSQPNMNLENHLDLTSASLEEFQNQCQNLFKHAEGFSSYLDEKFHQWIAKGYHIFIAARTKNQFERLQLQLKHAGFQCQLYEEDRFQWDELLQEQKKNSQFLPVLAKALPESLRYVNEPYLFLRDEDFFGKRSRTRSHRTSGTLANRAHALSFGDLKPGDAVIHKLHGLGVYQGLKVMPIQGVDAEFIQLEYKDGDKLYLPIFRVNQIQKYSGGGAKNIDKLGGSQWNRIKKKVKKQVQDIASELLKLYAQRAKVKRPSFSVPGHDFLAFENSFPYEETDDQLKTINDVLSDMTSDKPMDRLICGDVGFGKTEIAMRAAFKAVEDGRQVALICPTTILCFQHAENFKKRFKDWPIKIKALNRFFSAKEIKATLEELKQGQVDIVIGTHRLLSKDVFFKNLGLLIVDEEQKFGVKHKERIRQMKVSVDTLAMSATPIPRTLNMSLVGLRDLSLITTPPVDRLPTRTFVCKFDKETFRKAIDSEIHRGGQIFFLHNRVHSIYAVASELREIVPQARIAVAHGQMEEKELEKTMLSFFHHEIDVLVCTTIIESGMDIPRANTMFIDNAHALGLSQLYQLRGRVGRSKSRAYCYLLVPPNRKLDDIALERLKVIQENTSLGSGITIAQHDLELRGSGDILGQEQSGHINAIGYEMYLELLEDAIHEAKGEPTRTDSIEPDINIRIPALIPDKYMPDIRLRLSYYKALSEIDSAEELDRIEEELQDQFGPLPEPVHNLMGLMLIRKFCKDLGIKDISSSTSMITLSFTENTPLPPDRIVQLSLRENKKYAITPDHKFKIRMKTITWPNVYDELVYLKTLCR